MLWVPNHYHKTCELMLQLVWVDTVEKQIHHVFNQYFEDIFIRIFYDLSKVYIKNIIELVYWDIFCCKLVVYELHFLEKRWIKTRKKCLRQFGFLNFFLRLYNRFKATLFLPYSRLNCPAISFKMWQCDSFFVRQVIDKWSARMKAIRFFLQAVFPFWHTSFQRAWNIVRLSHLNSASFSLWVTCLML